jgi:hypothetical protein
MEIERYYRLMRTRGKERHKQEAFPDLAMCGGWRMVFPGDNGNLIEEKDSDLFTIHARYTFPS